MNLKCVAQGKRVDETGIGAASSSGDTVNISTVNSLRFLFVSKLGHPESYIHIFQ